MKLKELLFMISNGIKIYETEVIDGELIERMLWRCIDMIGVPLSLLERKVEWIEVDFEEPDYIRIDICSE